MTLLRALRRLPPLETGLLILAVAILAGIGFARQGTSESGPILDSFSTFDAASGGYRGRAAALIKQAAYLAIDLGKPTIDRKHFASVFEETYQVGDVRNPFLIPDINNLGPLKEIDLPQRPRNLTLLSGAKDVGADGVATGASQ